MMVFLLQLDIPWAVLMVWARMTSLGSWHETFEEIGGSRDRISEHEDFACRRGHPCRESLCFLEVLSEMLPVP